MTRTRKTRRIVGLILMGIASSTAGPYEMSDVVHENDAYGRLVGLCSRMEYVLELATLKVGMELRVSGPGRDVRISVKFLPGRENHAAAALLRKLRTTA
jgi:hypothetical protein